MRIVSHAKSEAGSRLRGYRRIILGSEAGLWMRRGLQPFRCLSV